MYPCNISLFKHLLFYLPLYTIVCLHITNQKYSGFGQSAANSRSPYIYPKKSYSVTFYCAKSEFKLYFIIRVILFQYCIYCIIYVHLKISLVPFLLTSAHSHARYIWHVIIIFNVHKPIRQLNHIATYIAIENLAAKTL